MTTPSERDLSMGTDIITPKRNKLSDNRMTKFFKEKLYLGTSRIFDFFWRCKNDSRNFLIRLTRASVRLKR